MTTTQTITVTYRNASGRIIRSSGWVSFSAALRRVSEIERDGGTVVDVSNLL